MYPLIISELTGTNILTLTDAALPAQGVEIGAETRMVQTYYPGTSTPSTQIMGTQEKPILLRGVWRDEWIGLTDGALALVETGRALLQGQMRCELQWNDLVRRGYVSAFTATLRRRGYWEWSLTFAVDQADEAVVVAVPMVPAATPFSFANLLAAALQYADEAATVAISVNNVLQAVA